MNTATHTGGRRSSGEGGGISDTSIYIGWVRGRPEGQRERGMALHAMPQHQMYTHVETLLCIYTSG